MGLSRPSKSGGDVRGALTVVVAMVLDDDIFLIPGSSFHHEEDTRFLRRTRRAVNKLGALESLVLLLTSSSSFSLDDS
jgi:hypothetical protein